MEKIKKIFQAFKNLKISRTITSDLQCPDCKINLLEDSGYLSLGICSACGHKDTLTAKQWINLIFDQDSFDEKFLNIDSPDPLHFNDSKSYKQRIKQAKDSTGEQSAVTTGYGHIKGIKVVAAIFDFKFLGGSMGYAVGEKITAAIDKAIVKKIPVLVVTCSGGARMQEGTLALAQMIKTTNAINNLHDAHLPLIGILANPTTGGVFASFANQADILIAEREALIGFAGPRVRAVNDEEQDRVLSEEILANGLIDNIVPRNELKQYLERVLGLITANEIKVSSPQPSISFKDIRKTSNGWESVTVSRASDRPSAKDYIDQIFSDFIELKGDRNGLEDDVLIGGFAKLALKNVMIVAQDRNGGQSETTKGRVSTAGYRKAVRLIKIANTLQLPIICFVDTPGANDSIENEKIGLAKSISDTIAELSSSKVETISVILGEGGSGGAIALCCTDRVFMQENSFLAITSPEGAAAILYRDKKHAEDVANALGVTAIDHENIGFVDQVIPEPVNHNIKTLKEASRSIYDVLTETILSLQNQNQKSRLIAREKKWNDLGKNTKISGKIQRLLLGITRKIKI